MKRFLRTLTIFTLLTTFPVLLSRVRAIDCTSFVNFERKTQRLCVRDITQSKDGVMWLAAEDGLYSFDGYHLVRLPFMENGKEHHGLGCCDKVEDKGDSLLITTQKSILSFNKKERTYRVIGSKEQDDYSDFASKPTCILKDGDRTWVGTARSLQLMKDGRVGKEWPMPVVKCLQKTAQELLVGTDNGLFVIDLQSQEILQHILHDTSRENSLSGDAVWCMYRDKNKNLWLGTNGGVSVIPFAPTLKTYRLSDITGKTRGNQIYVAFADYKNRLWLGGTNGLICIENLGSAAQAFRWYTMDSKQYPLTHNRVRSIIETSGKHNIMLGGDLGLWKYNEGTKRFDECKLGGMSNNWVYEISQLPDNKLYIATYDESIVVDEDDFSTLFTDETKRVKDKKKNVDLLRQYGLEDKFLTAYDDRRNNRIIFGGTDEFAILDKGALKKQRREPLLITDIKVNGEHYVKHDEAFESNDFLLDKDTRMLEVYFTDFDYSESIPTSYLYTIDEGRTWITCHDGTLLLTNLSPGSYNVCLKTADDTSSLTIRLHIAYPWYATWWAYMLYLIIFILFVTGCFMIVRQRRRIIEERKERDALLKSAREKEQALISENEHLAHQLHVQLLQSHEEEAKDELSEDEKLLLRVTTIIEENMSGELDVNTLSKISGIHQKQLYRKIKEMTGMTTVAYIRDLRLKKAATLLAKGGFSVAEVMFRVGFSNPSYFTKCFQEVYGVSPSEYLKGKTI